MNRRRFLASASAAASLALAGCMSGQDNEPSTTTEPTDTPTQTTTTTTTDDGPLAVGEEVSLSGESAMTVVDASASAFVVSRDGAERHVHSGNTTRTSTSRSRSTQSTTTIRSSRRTSPSS